MNELSPNGFYGRHVSCSVYYKSGFLDYEVAKLDNIQQELEYYKNTDAYIKGFIDYIKQNVIKKVKNLNSVKIELAIFDKDVILHRLIITVANMIKDILKCKEKIDFYKSVIVRVQYENETVFMGNINFTGLN
jgi:hypothetical protein